MRTADPGVALVRVRGERDRGSRLRNRKQRLAHTVKRAKYNDSARCLNTCRFPRPPRSFAMGRKAEIQRMQLEKLMGPEGMHC